MGEAESREMTIIAAVGLANGKSLDQIGAALCHRIGNCWKITEPTWQCGSHWRESRKKSNSNMVHPRRSSGH